MAGDVFEIQVVDAGPSEQPGGPSVFDVRQELSANLKDLEKSITTLAKDTQSLAARTSPVGGPAVDVISNEPRGEIYQELHEIQQQQGGQAALRRFMELENIAFENRRKAAEDRRKAAEERVRPVEPEKPIEEPKSTRPVERDEPFFRMEPEPPRQHRPEDDLPRGVFRMEPAARVPDPMEFSRTSSGRSISREIEEMFSRTRPPGDRRSDFGDRGGRPPRKPPAPPHPGDPDPFAWKYPPRPSAAFRLGKAMFAEEKRRREKDVSFIKGSAVATGIGTAAVPILSGGKKIGPGTTGAIAGGVASFAAGASIGAAAAIASAAYITKLAVDETISRGAHLSQYSAPLATEFAQAEVRQVQRDIRESRERGPAISELVQGTSDIGDKLQSIFLPFQKIIDRVLVVVTNIFDTILTPFALLGEAANAIIGPIMNLVGLLGDFLSFHWEKLIDKVMRFVDWSIEKGDLPKYEAGSVLGQLDKLRREAAAAGMPGKTRQEGFELGGEAAGGVPSFAMPGADLGPVFGSSGGEF